MAQVAIRQHRSCCHFGAIEFCFSNFTSGFCALVTPEDASPSVPKDALYVHQVLLAQRGRQALILLPMSPVGVLVLLHCVNTGVTSV
jgi:hypothetical protein